MRPRASHCGHTSRKNGWRALSAIARSHRDPNNRRRRMLGCATWLSLEPLEAGIMKARRLELVAALLFAGWVVAWFAFSSAGIKETTASIVDHRAPFLLADFGVAYAPPPATETSNASIANAENAPISNADVAVAAELVTRTDTTAASDEPESFVKVASADPSQTLPPETPPVQAAASTSDLVPKDLEAMSSLEILDGCQVT